MSLLPPEVVDYARAEPSRVRARLLSLALAGSLTMIGLQLLFTPGALRIPVAYTGDELIFQCMAKTVSEGHSPLLVERLAAPDHGDWSDFPLNMKGEFFLVRLLCLAGLEPVTSLYLVWVMMVGLAAVTMCWMLQEFGVSRGVDVALGVLFALQPYTWVRHVMHFNLHFPWVPLVVGTCVGLAAGMWTSRLPRWSWFGCFVQGAVGSLYFTFFSLWILVAAACMGMLLRGWPSARQGGLCLLAVGVGLGIHLTPPLVHRMLQGTNPQALVRYVGESESYGLKLRILLCPRGNHPVPTLRKLAEYLMEPTFPSGGEADTSRLGSVGSAGLLLCVGLAVLAAVGRAPAWARPVALPALWLLVFTFAVCTVGGLGSIFNALLTPNFRAYNRGVVIIEALIFVVLGQALVSRISSRPRQLLLFGLTVLAVLDQAWAPISPDRAISYLQDREFVAKLESALPEGAMIYQLPQTSFLLETSTPGRMRTYDHAKPYLHSHKLRWSWGYMTGVHDGWHRWLARLPVPQLIKALRARGYTAVWLDRWGDPALLERFEGLLGEADFIDPGLRYYVFDLRRQPRARITTPALEAAHTEQVSVTVLQAPTRVQAGSVLRAQVQVHNQTELWLASNPPWPVFVSYHWLARDGSMLVWDGARTGIPPLEPGGTTKVWVSVQTPGMAGTYRLQLRLMQEQIRWFERGPKDLEVELFTP